MPVVDTRHQREAEHARGGLLFEVWATAKLLEVIEQMHALNQKLNKVLGMELSVEKKESQIMAAVKIEQETLDADGDTLTQLAQTLSDLVASGNLSDADQTKLNAGIAALQALGTPVVVTPPEPAPDAPTS